MKTSQSAGVAISAGPPGSLLSRIATTPGRLLEPCSRATCRSRTLARLAAALHAQPATLTPDGPPVSRPRMTSSQTAGAMTWPDALPNSIREPSGPGADPDSVTVSPSAR